MELLPTWTSRDGRDERWVGGGGQATGVISHDTRHQGVAAVEGERQGAVERPGERADRARQSTGESTIAVSTGGP